MNNNFKITFQHILSKENKTGLSPVYGVITKSKQKIKLSTGVWIEEASWDDKKQKVKPKHSRHLQLNHELKKFEDRVWQAIDLANYEKRNLDLKQLKSLLTCSSLNEQKTILSGYNGYILKLQATNKRVSTISKWKTLFADMQNFLDNSYKGIDLPIKSISKEFVEEYEKYLFKKGNVKNTITAKMKRLKTVTEYATSLGWTNECPFKGIKLTSVPAKKEFLTKRELKSIEMLNLNSKCYNTVRDIFLFMCYTGLAYSDIMRLQKDNLFFTDASTCFIKQQRQKTGTEAMPPVFSKALKIINNYETDPRSIARDCIFPKYSLDKLNTYLKKIITHAGIEKRITSHSGRHTFATISIEDRVPIESISRALGHRSIKETEVYAKITAIKIEKDFIDFAQFLN